MLYPNKDGTVADLLEEAAKQAQLADGGSGQLRLLEIVGHKIVSVVKEFTHLDTLPVGSAKVSSAPRGGEGALVSCLGCAGDNASRERGCPVESKRCVSPRPLQVYLCDSA